MQHGGKVTTYPSLSIFSVDVMTRSPYADPKINEEHQLYGDFQTTEGCMPWS